MSESVSSLAATKALKRRSFWADLAIRLVKGKPLGMAGALIVLLLLLTALFANLVAPYGMNEVHVYDRMQPPSAKYILGSDTVGRDMLSRIIFGARISMIVGLAGASLNILTACSIGLVSGFMGGKTDIVVQRFVDAWMCFPPLFIILTVMAILGPGLIQVILVLGISNGIGTSRVIRSAVIGIKQNVYIDAGNAIGCSPTRMLSRHVLPNVMATIIIGFTLSMGGIILAEATISFLGYGIPPPTPSWGGMLAGIGRAYVLQAPWLALWPGLALALSVFGINVFGDALRDLLDPRLRGGVGRYSKNPPRRRRSGSQADYND